MSALQYLPFAAAVLLAAPIVISGLARGIAVIRADRAALELTPDMEILSHD